MIAASLLLATLAAADAAQARPEDTEIWSPVPPVVRPPPVSSTPPPSDALVLLGGADLDEWAADDGSPARWSLESGVMSVVPGAGGIRTRRRFDSYQLHLEWRIPASVTGSGQGRGNSGVFLASTGPGDAGYELQILDSHGNATYVNGQAGSLYKQAPPLVNPTRPAGEWQSYDVIWTAPRFAADGTVERPATATVLLTGVLVQNHRVLAGPTVYIGRPRYAPHGPSPIRLQDHGAAVSFRNIWVRPLP